MTAEVFGVPVEEEARPTASSTVTTGFSTPDIMGVEADIDHATHFQKLNAALRLTPSPEDLSIPAEGRIENFGVVMSGVYRSAFPTKEGYSFLGKLNLKTVL